MDEPTSHIHVPMDVRPETHINAPVNVHGWCFGLIPANGNWLDDIINWQARQFRQAAVARRMAACWNACRGVPTETLEGLRTTTALDVTGERAKLTIAIENAKAIKSARSILPSADDSGENSKTCSYPRCTCPFDAPSDPNWCALGLPHPGPESRK